LDRGSPQNRDALLATISGEDFGENGYMMLFRINNTSAGILGLPFQVSHAFFIVMDIPNHLTTVSVFPSRLLFRLKGDDLEVIGSGMGQTK